MAIKTKLLSFANSDILTFADFLEMYRQIPESRKFSFAIYYIIFKFLARIIQLLFYYYMFSKIDNWDIFQFVSVTNK